MEHIEQAGVQSGDSACSLPPYSLSQPTIEELKRQTREMARALNVVGLMNVQFAIQEKDGQDVIFVLEVNRAPRAPCPSSARPRACSSRGGRALHGGPHARAEGHHAGVTPPYFT